MIRRSGENALYTYASRDRFEYAHNTQSACVTYARAHAESKHSSLRLVQTEGGRDASGVRYAESVRPAGDKFVHTEYGLHTIPVFNRLCILLIKWHLNCFHRVFQTLGDWVFQTLGDCLSLVSPSSDLTFALLLAILNFAQCGIRAASEKIAQRATRELPLVSCAQDALVLCTLYINIVECDFVTLA